MYGIHRVAPDSSVVTLPPAPGVGLPFGHPVNVAVFHGESPAVLTTGMAGARDALVTALAEIDIDPGTVTDVFLTGTSPEDIGNVDVFERATVHAAPAPSGPAPPTVAARVATIARELIAGEEGHPEWDQDAVDGFVERYVDQPTDAAGIRPVADGERFAAGAVEITALLTPGVSPRAACWHAPDRGWLFGGQTLVLAQDPLIQVPADFSDSVARLSRLEPALILPAFGGPERNYFAFFRSLSLSVANLLQNMPFALQGPTSPAHVAYRDLGYWPGDLIRFAAFVDRYAVMLAELERVGVAARDGEGVWAPYTLDRPARF